MTDSPPDIWIRINGIGHAFARELGCDCGRCATVNLALSSPPEALAEFDGWDDPPWRAHTSGSILIPDRNGAVQRHLLVDVGAGVVDSLACSRLAGLTNLDAVLISHWHPDHIIGLNQLCESLRRVRDRTFAKVPVYCTLVTYQWAREKKGLAREFDEFLAFREVLSRVPFHVGEAPTVTITPIAVAHGKIDGAVIYVAQIDSRKAVFAWDIDVPAAPLPSGHQTNRDVIEENRDLLYGADILFMAANTWSATETKTGRTGHTSYQTRS